MNIALWIIQGLLAALFLFAGGTKLIMPIEEMTKDMPTMPGLLLRFIGVCEILGAFGLVLPWLTRIKPWLTPLAAAGLVIIMIGAVVITVRTMGVLPAIFPFVVGIFAVWIAWARWRIAPLPSRSQQTDGVSAEA